MSARPFSVGDRVRVNCPESAHHGKETVITNGPAYIADLATGTLDHIGYEVDLPTESGQPEWPRAWFGPRRLMPIYDGNEKVSWSECEWQPKKVRA